MQTPAPKLAHLLCLGLLLALTACKEPAIDEKPQILGMSIAGIPQENISIDQNQRIITVLSPPTMPSFLLEPTFTLSPQAHLSEKETISLANYCPAEANYTGRSPSLEIVVKIENQKQVNGYTVQVKGAAPLRIVPPAAPVVYDSKGTQLSDYSFDIPVEYYYGSSFIEYIAVTPTGSTRLGWLGPGGSVMESCDGLLNKVRVSLYGYRTEIEGKPTGSTLKPGVYDLDFRLIDGTIVHAAGYFLIK